MTPPRILFVDHAGVLGGAELSLMDVATAFASSASVVLLADGPFRAALEARGLSVAVEPLRAMATVKKRSVLPSPAAALDAWRVAGRVIARAHDADILYANSQKAFIVCALAGARSGRRVVWHLRDILAPPHFSRSTVRVAVWLANRYASRIIANSEATRRAFIDAGGREALVRVVYNGIDPAPFDAVTPGAAHALRASFGAQPGTTVAVHVGRFHQWKGQHVLLRALATLPGMHAWIVGAPLFGEHAVDAELRELAAALRVDDRVRFLGFRDNVPALLRAADVVVHSSVYPEPFGRVVVEGMLAGRPVIAANAGGVPEIVTDGETGLLVPPGDVPALAAALRCVQDDPASAAAMAARASERAREQFTVPMMVRGVEAALAGL